MTNSEKSQMILRKSRNVKISYILTTWEEEGPHKIFKTKEIFKTKIVSIYKYYLDGTSASRIESTSYSKNKKDSGFTYIDLKLKDGSQWDIYGDIAIRRKDLEKEDLDILKEYEEYLKSDSEYQKNLKSGQKTQNPETKGFLYSVKNALFKEIPCYKIKGISSVRNIAIKYIDKKDFFVYSSENYSKNGKKVNKKIIESIKKMENTELNDSLFQIEFYALE